MNAAGDSLLIGDLEQHRSQHTTFFPVEGGEQSVLVFSRNPPNLLQSFLTIPGQVQGI